MSKHKLLRDFVDSSPKLLVGWESKDLSEKREEVLLIAIREARKDLYGFGITSTMRHAFNSYILVFKPAGDILDVMKLNMAVAMLRQSVRNAKTATKIERAQEDLRVTQVSVESLLGDLVEEIKPQVH